MDGVFPDWAKPFVDNASILVWERKRVDDSVVAFQNVLSGMTVLVSGMVEADGKRWLHVSFAYRNRLPTWDDLKEVKETFIGKDKKALQVFPPEAEYVNVNPYCLHLWHCADGDVVPDFTKGRPKGHL
jgi:hypothetical protein